MNISGYDLSIWNIFETCERFTNLFHGTHDKFEVYERL
jgi:hypothetical protein